MSDLLNIIGTRRRNPRQGLPVSDPALLGDSITDQGTSLNKYWAAGFMVAGMNKLGWPFFPKYRGVSAYVDAPDWDFGYGSYSPQNILEGNRAGDGVYPLNDIATANPLDVFVHIGSNPSGDDAPKIIQIWDTMLAAGRRVFAAEILPRGNGAFGYDADDLAQCNATNATIKIAAAVRGIPFLEWASSVALSPGGFADTQYFQDGVHPNNRGAQVLGDLFAAFISPYCGQPFAIPADGSALWRTSNPYVAGDSSGLATGYTKSGATVTASKITDGDGTVWQRLVCAQSPSYGSFTYRQSSGTGTFAEGDVVRAVARIRGAVSGWDLKSLRLEIFSTVSAATAVRAAGNDTANAGVAAQAVMLPIDGHVLISAPYTVPASTTAMWSYLTGHGSGTIDVRQIGLVKVN